ncbi:Plexin-D1 like [Heracleum sosnowskyi]|uniref:Plexin-D1 like n=1 Tax=Heracleum sosnowskyi TaxID=360622 RepID=A0AAD8H3B7_9APIA|nr:Plexin-D1 like [Heracleum sosnowskyi]
MASNARISYQRLRNEGGFDDYGRAGIGRVSSWTRRPRRVHVRRRLKIKIPGLKRFLRRKARVVVTSWSKIVKRLKESQSHFGDLFAGNYLFMQVTPTSLKCLQQPSKNQVYSDFGSRYYLPKVS